MIGIRRGIVDLDKYDFPDEIADKLLSEGDRITSESQREMFKTKFLEKYEYEGKFVNTMDERLKELSNTLTLSQLGLFASLVQFMDFKTKNLIWRGKPMTQSDISMSIGVNPSTVNKQLKGLVDNGFVYRDKEGKGAIYKLNEEIVFIGKFLKDEYSTKIFTQRFKELIYGLKLNEVGLFYRLVPYLNTNMYVLSYNPNELDPQKVHPITTYQEIANLIDMDRSGIKRIIDKLKRNNLIYTVEGKKMVFVFNPEVVTRKYKKDGLEDILEIVKNEYE